MLPPTYVEGFHDLEAVKKMEYRPLGNTGLLVSKLSFGGAPLGNHFGKYVEEEAIATVREAFRQGINYIDTAPYYGQGKSEELIGKALKGIPRQAYYIATKVGRYEPEPEKKFDFSAEKTRESIRKSLDLLGLDYVDVIQVHDIDFAPSLDIILSQTLPELARQVAAGKAKHIGITGYTLPVLKECIEKTTVNIQSILTYARLTLIDDSLLSEVPFFKERNIGVISAAAPSQGMLTNQGPPSWHLAPADIKAAAAKAGQYCKDHNVELGKLAVWYSFQFEGITTSLVGIQDIKVLNQNLDILRNGITEHEKEVYLAIKEKYFSKLKQKHYEGVEVEEYWRSLKK